MASNKPVSMVFLEKMEYMFSRDLLMRLANSVTEIPLVSNTSLIFCPMWISSIPRNSRIMSKDVNHFSSFICILSFVLFYITLKIIILYQQTPSHLCFHSHFSNKYNYFLKMCFEFRKYIINFTADFVEVKF